MKVNILGTDYEVVRDNTGRNPKLKNAHGYCETYSKKIVIEYDKRLESDCDILENYGDFQEKVLRHEIVHAFLHESGLDNDSEWARNEEIVDWIAFQIPKMVKAMQSLQCIGEKTQEVQNG